MKRLFSALTLLFVLSNSLASAEENYISDDLFIYMHSGPSTKFRIVGSVNAGEKINRLNENSGYTKIVDNRGREGWVDSKYVSPQASLKVRFPKLEAELTAVKASLSKAKNDLQTKNKDLIDSLEQRTLRVQELESHNSNLNQQLIDAQTEIRGLRALIDTQKDDLLMRYFAYGAIVAGGGLLLGLILPSVIPRRKKQYGGWA